MALEFIILLPFIVGAITFFLPVKTGRFLVAATAAGLFGLAVLIWLREPDALLPEYFRTSPEGLLVLLVTSFLFFIVSVYSVGYLEKEKLDNERWFNACMLFFVAAMNMATITDHIIMFWIAIETTTLASARQSTTTRLP